MLKISKISTNGTKKKAGVCECQSTKRGSGGGKKQESSPIREKPSSSVNTLLGFGVSGKKNTSFSQKR
ncbi:unnamed protein product [Allacma fusca]|uniref:Uncharacterized protein n=1 Tax=Allacma fusca TaxID=39272 RepID=A0A8J2NSJ7_9HEXA|nr:unnamed protein product [Allacma fusca]